MKTPKHKMWQNAKTLNVTKLKNSNYGKTQKNIKCVESQKKKWQNLKLKMWQTKKETKLKTQNVTRLKHSKCDKTQKLKMWQNWQSQNATKLKKKTSNATKLNKK